LLMDQTLSSIKEYNNFVQSGALDDAAKNSIMSFLSAFSASVYNSANTSENESIDKLNQLCRDNEQTLVKLGLTFDSEYEKLTFNTNIDMDTNDFKTAYKELFGENAAFGNKVSEYCKNIFSGIIQPEKLGVSVIDAQI
ncbi:MAG: hypothetical protein K2M91_12910, partial [Lachnospiraceae bacterium]|nr:hypothetical protein [Lachnospiraceae bacterium]